MFNEQVMVSNGDKWWLSYGSQWVIVVKIWFKCGLTMVYLRDEWDTTGILMDIPSGKFVTVCSGKCLQNQIVNFPTKIGGYFHIYESVYQRVYSNPYANHGAGISTYKTGSIPAPWSTWAMTF